MMSCVYRRHKFLSVHQLEYTRVYNAVLPPVATILGASHFHTDIDPEKPPGHRSRQGNTTPTQSEFTTSAHAHVRSITYMVHIL